MLPYNYQLALYCPMTYNICAYLVGKYPLDFARWLFTPEVVNVEVIPTEDLILLQIEAKIIHLEFILQPEPGQSLPLKMLESWLKLQEKYPQATIEQIVVCFKNTGSETLLVNQYEKDNLSFSYRIIPLWQENSIPFLANPGLWCLAPLTRSENPRTLLEQVAMQIDSLKDIQEQRELTAYTYIIAGLAFEEAVIKQILREKLMQESFTYRDILQQGEDKGLNQGLKLGLEQGLRQGKLELIIRQLTHKFGTISPELSKLLGQLSSLQLEDLAEALLEFQSMSGLAIWLEENS